MSGSTWSWVGTAGSAWATPGNWSPNGPPSAGGTAIINNTGSSVPTLSGTELNSNTIDLSNGATIAFLNGSTLDGLSVVNGSAGTVDVSGVFTDYGNLSVASTLTVAMAAGATLVSNGPTPSGPGTDVGINNGLAGYDNGGTLYVLGGTLDNQEVHVNGGYTDVTSALMNNDELSVDGGTLEIAQPTTVSPSQITFADAYASTLKFDNPGSFNGDGLGTIYAFTSLDTIDIGPRTVGTVVFNADPGINGGTLIVEDTSGNSLFSAELSGGDATSFATGAYAVTGGTAGSFQVTQGSGDTLITEAGSAPTTGPTTWTWNGGSGSFTDNTQWTKTNGLGNSNGYPGAGDTAVVNSGSALVLGYSADLAAMSIGGAAAADVAVTSTSSLEVNTGLVMLGQSTLSVDNTSAVDLGTSGTAVAGAVAIDGGVSLVGDGLVSAALQNNGVVVVSNAANPANSTGGTLEITGTIGGTGALSLAAGSTLLLDGAIVGSQSVAFGSGAAETLVLGTPGSSFGDAITGLADGDRIEFGNGMTVTSASVVNGNTIAVVATTGTYDLTNVSFAPAAGQSFTVTTDATTSDSAIVLGNGIAGAPAISGTVGSQTDAGAGPISPFSGVTITDPNVGQTETVTVTLSSPANGTLTALGSGSYDTGTGVYTVIGTAAGVTGALDGLQFDPAAVSAGQTVTTGFTIAVVDSLDQSASDTTTSVIATGSTTQPPPSGTPPSGTPPLGTPPAAPSIAGAVANQSDIDVQPVAPFSGVTISDPNASQTETVTVTLSAAANGALSNLDGGSYNAQTGVYTVSGSAAAVTSALDGLQFIPTFEQAGAGQSVTTGFTIAVTDSLGQSASNSTTSVVTARANAQQTEIYQDYEAILGRAPDPIGFADWQQSLATGTTPASMANTIAHSTEAGDDINALYEQALGRPVDPNGLATAEQLLSNGASLSTILAGLAASPEATADINALYQRILGRPADPGGLAVWRGQLAAGVSLATVASDIAHSSEAQGDIAAQYQQVLQRAPDPTGLAEGEQDLANGLSLNDLRAGLADSPEAQGDINTLYLQVLGRPADPSGIAQGQAMLANGDSWQTLRSGLATSPEAASDIGKLYQQILGRAADAGGLAVWQGQLAAGASLTAVAADIAHSPEATADLSASYNAVYGAAPNAGVLATLEGRLAAGASLSSVEASLHGPLVYDTVAGQAITDQSTAQPFGVAMVTDPNTGDAETATITLTNTSGTATDANGTLSGTGLTHSGAGTYTLSASSAGALTNELNALLFTPTKGGVSVGQSVTTDMSVSVNDTAATGNDTTTSITATAVGSPTNLNFIYGSAGSDTFTTAASPAAIAENVNPLGSDVVTNFNVAQDVVQLSAAMFANYTAVESAITNMGGSAVLHFDSTDSLTLQGIAPGSLTANNFRFV